MMMMNYFKDTIQNKTILALLEYLLQVDKYFWSSKKTWLVAVYHINVCYG